MTNNQIQKYNLRNAQFAGGFAEIVQGDQVGGIINNYGQNADRVMHLLKSLQGLVQSFPQEQQEDLLLALDDLENDLEMPNPDPQRLGQRLKRLLVLATMGMALASGAASFSGNVKDFTSNVLELTETLGVPVELVETE